MFAYLKSTAREQPTVEIKERIWRVEVQEVMPRTLTPTLTLYGQVETPKRLKAAAPAASIVKDVIVKEGDRVTKHQLLVRLDERDFLPRLRQARAEVEELQALIASEDNRYQSDQQALRHEEELLALARAEVERNKALQKRKLGAESALDKARQDAARQALTVTSRRYSIDDHRARLEQLKARLIRAEAQLQEKELEYERSNMRAPYDGIVASVAVTAGDRVKQSDILLEMYSLGDLEVRARIPAPYQEELLRAQNEGKRLTGIAERGGGQIKLRLDRISGQASPSGVDGLFRIDEGAALLRTGQVLRFQLQRPPQHNAVAVPYQAVYGGNRVYKLVEGRMEGIRVEPLGGYFDGEEKLLVRSEALRAGDRIVITHLPNAISGLRAEALP
jgi:multidrug efflux pump subunit AcrA (membrane-fusion protein)